MRTGIALNRAKKLQLLKATVSNPPNAAANFDLDDGVGPRIH